MKLFQTTCACALLAGSIAAWSSVANAAADSAGPAASGGHSTALAEVIVTAQKRSTNLQTTPIAISAVSGATLKKNSIETFEDLAHSVSSLSFSQNNTLRQEFNIRGAVNTRLGSPTADQSVGLFEDGVYVSRSGILTPEFYDISQVEVIRGPQGVLLGRNVAGGAISVTSAPPEFSPSGEMTVGYGNYDLVHTSGYFTGPLTDSLAGRLSFQTDNHSGYSEDVGHHVQLDNLNQVSFRGQLLFQPAGSDFRAHLTAEYLNESNNGMCPIAEADTSKGDPNSAPGVEFHPWSGLRADTSAAMGSTLTNRQCLPTWPTFAGNTVATSQGEHHHNASVALSMEKGLAGDMKITSVTGYREGQSHFLYDQSGIGPEDPYGLGPNPFDFFAFAFPVEFNEHASQISQEVRLQSDYTHSRIDWIGGLYYERDRTNQNNTFWAENNFPAPNTIDPGTGQPIDPLATIEGQDNWRDNGGTETYAVFAQAGYKFTDDIKLTAGVRYTHDKKDGYVIGTAQQFGDQYHGFSDPVPLTTLTGCGGTGSTVICDPLYSGPHHNPNYATAYGAQWDAVTPQAILQYTPSPDLMVYFTVGKGFKGGGFENDTDFAGAQTPYQPETDVNYEVGLKSRFLDGRAQLNLAAYYTDYDNLQVEQTNDVCLCNIVNNAGNAVFKGVEAEFEIRPIRQLHFWASGDLASAKYIKFIDANGVSDSGKNAQRTPAYQFVVGGEATTDFFSIPDALMLHITYKYQGKMYWDPANLTSEQAYGLLDGRLTLNLPNKNWSVSLWGKNLTDTQYRTNIIAFFGDEVGTYAPPRTYGMEVSAKF
jgi:iron complex outermembrane receptor protein